MCNLKVKTPTVKTSYNRTNYYSPSHYYNYDVGLLTTLVQTPENNCVDNLKMIWHITITVNRLEV